MPRVKPELLVWARKTAGLTLPEAASKLAIKQERLAAYEAGEAEPSRSLIVRMSKQYRRPLVTFYLGSPPPRGDRGEDFRTLPEVQVGTEALVDALVRDIKARQALVRAVLEDDEDVEPVSFVGSMKISDGVEAVLASMRATLGLDLVKFRAEASPGAAFALLRSRVEATGVFVLLIGNLGSHHSTIDVNAFRGFALADPIAPFVVINDGDAKTAWSFTLLHEVAHLWLGKTGISGASTANEVERFCNDVASAFLLPTAELLQLQVAMGRAHDLDAKAAFIGAFAQKLHLSSSLVAYRLMRAGVLPQAAWKSLDDHFRAEWRKQKKVKAPDKDGGPNYYVVRRHRLGAALLRFVSRTLDEGLLTPTKASRVLGVKPRSVEPLLSGAVLSAGA